MLSPLEVLNAAVASPMSLSQRLPPWSAVMHTAMIAGISTSKFRSPRATAGGCFVWLSNVVQSVMTSRLGSSCSRKPSCWTSMSKNCWTRTLKTTRVSSGALVCLIVGVPYRLMETCSVNLSASVASSSASNVHWIPTLPAPVKCGSNGSGSAVMTVRQQTGSTQTRSLAPNVKTRWKRMVAATWLFADVARRFAGCVVLPLADRTHGKPSLGTAAADTRKMLTRKSMKLRGICRDTCIIMGDGKPMWPARSLRPSR